MDKSTKQVVWVLSAVIALSLAFGVAMFAPAEHRAQKLSEMTQKYQARQRQQVSHLKP